MCWWWAALRRVVRLVSVLCMVEMEWFVRVRISARCSGVRGVGGEGVKRQVVELRVMDGMGVSKGIRAFGVRVPA